MDKNVPTTVVKIVMMYACGMSPAVVTSLYASSENCLGKMEYPSLFNIVSSLKDAETTSRNGVMHTTANTRINTTKNRFNALSPADCLILLFASKARSAFDFAIVNSLL